MTVGDFVGTSDLADYLAADPASLLLKVQATIRSYCGWHVAPSLEETVTTQGRGPRHLWLPTLHVTAVASITDEGTTLTADEFDWSSDGYVERRSGYWSTRPGQIVVTMTHGYEEIPEDLIGVAVAVAARAAASPSGIVRQGTGPFNIEHTQVKQGVAGGVALLEHEKDTLGKFKLPPRP